MEISHFNDFKVNDGGIRTLFIFLNLQKHIEYNVGSMPLMPEGVVIEFDFLIKDGSNKNKLNRLEGKYVISRRVLKYSTSRTKFTGLSQYLELKPCE